ncbi:STM4015 family protein [Nonomuraea longicatena]|uniref:Leucine-rich repeat domain-containing protein n=1 Tax=Nonomuraea longicatena TaxID=83682 RepID=A0ABN1QF22_9ACTN
MRETYLQTFHGLPVHAVVDGVVVRVHGDPDEPGEPVPMPEPGTAAWRVAAGPITWDETTGDATVDGPEFAEALDLLLRRVDPAGITAIVAGWWGPEFEDYDSGQAIDPLVAAADRLTSLEAVFLGDHVTEETTIAYIDHADPAPLLRAYPGLRRLEARGCVIMKEPVEHPGLEVLRIESGGLPGETVRTIGDGVFPALRHLELWLGVIHYGGDSGPDDWAGILSGAGLPALRHLGLQDSEDQDDVAAAVATAPVVARLESLRLSMGTLSDVGAEALLSGQPLTHLRELDLDHHYLSEPMVERLRAALPGVRVSARAGGAPDDDDRYVAVAE